MIKIEQYKNKQYGCLTIIDVDRERMDKEKNNLGHANTYVFAKCNCDGNIKSYNLNKIKRGETKSCGHLKLQHGRQYKQNNIDILDDCYVLYIDNDKYYFDKDDYNIVSKKWWYKDSNGYATNAYVENNKTKYLRLHRFVLNVISPNLYVDHINKNIYDCRKCNLRICSHKENDRNSNLYCTNTSGIIGVSWDKHRNKWAAHICVNYKNINLGRYNKKEDAIIARLKAEKLYFGQFAPQQHLYEKYFNGENKNDN